MANKIMSTQLDWRSFLSRVWITEAGLHLIMRAASAVSSFLLFALVAHYLTVDDTRQVYFFSFAFGFLVVSLRTYCTITALLYSDTTRVSKLRKVKIVTHQLPWFTILVGITAIGALSVYGLQWWIVLSATAMIAICGFDADLLRAVVGRPTLFTSAFAVGGLLAIGYLWVMEPSTRDGGCIAFIVQWAPVAIINVKAYVRLWWRRAQPLRVFTSGTTLSLVGAMLLALYDGAVLNAPFLLSLPMDVGASLDLSIATRLFLSSLPFLPLMIHWSNVGHIHDMARSHRVAEYAIFGTIIAVTGVAAGLSFAVLYSVVGTTKVTVLQLGLFASLLGAYVLYACMSRYGMCNVSARARLVVLGSLLVAFYTILVSMNNTAAHSAAFIVSLQVCALVIAAAVGWSGLRAHSRTMHCI